MWSLVGGGDEARFPGRNYPFVRSNLQQFNHCQLIAITDEYLINRHVCGVVVIVWWGRIGIIKALEVGQPSLIVGGNNIPLIACRRRIIPCQFCGVSCGSGGGLGAPQKESSDVGNPSEDLWRPPWVAKVSVTG